MNEPQGWESRALCRNLNQLYEDTAYGVNETPKTVEDRQKVDRAKRVCIVCPVRQECLDSAMKEEYYLGGLERHGIRGGLTAKDRINIAAQDPLCARCGENPVGTSKSAFKTKRLCTTCQLSTQNDVSARYFPPGTEPMAQVFQLS